MSFPKKFKDHWVGVAICGGVRFFFAFIFVKMPNGKKDKDGKDEKEDTEIIIN